MVPLPTGDIAGGQGVVWVEGSGFGGVDDDGGDHQLIGGDGIGPGGVGIVSGGRGEMGPAVLAHAEPPEEVAVVAGLREIIEGDRGIAGPQWDARGNRVA